MGEEEKGILNIVIYKGIGLWIKNFDILKNYEGNNNFTL